MSDASKSDTAGSASDEPDAGERRGGHGHAHAHAHPHSHGAPEGSRDPEAHREPLSRGAGGGRLLFLDAFSGMAGDMTIAALVDLGVPASVVRDAVGSIGLSGVEPVFSSRFAGAIGATAFDVAVTGSHPERRFGEIESLIDGAELPPSVRTLALSIFRVLAEAEARVHRIAVRDVHFHEVGAVDAIADVVGAAACFDFLGAEVWCSPLPMGHGLVECRHGVLPLPAPATVECLRGVPTYDAGVEAELVTPTGAAIARAVPVRYARWPEVSPERVGWGAGTKHLPDRPNALRVVLGTPSTGASPEASDRTHVVVEATIDDMTGEMAGHAIRELMRSGAVDVWLVPATMKKGRPGMVLAALAPVAAEAAVAETMLRTTTTIGVRVQHVSRIERPRRSIQVDTPFGPVPIKISEGGYGGPRIKPEFDVCAELARQAHVPVHVVYDAALAAAKSR